MKYQMSIGLYVVGSKNLRGKERKELFENLPSEAEIEMIIRCGDVERKYILNAEKRDFGDKKSLGYFFSEKVRL